MAYFGRRPEKPGSVPGAGSGFEVQQERRAVKRVARIIRKAKDVRQERSLRFNRAARKAR